MHAAQTRRRAPAGSSSSRAPTSRTATSFELDSAPLTIGRGDQNDIPIATDEFASARHARFEPRRDGVWVAGSRLDERHVRERRHASSGRERLEPGRRRPRRRDRPEVRADERSRPIVGASRDTGRKRRRNEDAYVVEPPLFAVADGMGGAQAGEVASRLAAAALKESGADGGRRAARRRARSRRPTAASTTARPRPDRLRAWARR